MINFFLKIPPILWFLIAGGLCYMDYSEWESTVWEQLTNNIEAKKIELVTVRRDVQRVEQFNKQKDEKLKEIASYAEKFESSRREFPRTANLTELLKQFEDLSEKTGVELNSFKPGGTKPAELLMSQTLELKIRGSFAQMMSFLDGIANFARIVYPETLKLSDPKLRGNSYAVNAELSFVTFYFDESMGSQPPPKGAPQ
jgi:Tfp pilus assembly protein PilO